MKNIRIVRNRIFCGRIKTVLWLISLNEYAFTDSDGLRHCKGSVCVDGKWYGYDPYNLSHWE